MAIAKQQNQRNFIAKQKSYHSVGDYEINSSQKTKTIDQQFKNKSKIIFQEMYTENKWFKAGLITIGSLALIYFLGQSANILQVVSEDLRIWGMLGAESSFIQKLHSYRKVVK